MLETPEIVDTVSQGTAVIRLTVPRSQIQTVMGPAIGEVLAAVAAQSIGPAGPLFSYHLRMEPDFFDLEVGVPVAKPVTRVGRVVSGQLRATKAARAVYHGPYEGLADAWSQFDKWITSHGYKRASDLWENYVCGPESGPDSAGWRTEFYRPLVE